MLFVPVPAAPAKTPNRRRPWKVGRHGCRCMTREHEEQENSQHPELASELSPGSPLARPRASPPHRFRFCLTRARRERTAGELFGRDLVIDPMFAGGSQPPVWHASALRPVDPKGDRPQTRPRFHVFIMTNARGGGASTIASR